MSGFGTRTAILIASAAALLLVERIPALTAGRPAFRAIDNAIADMRNPDLNAEDMHALVAGYYEGLRNDVPLGVLEKDDVRATHNFLRYELRLHVKRAYPAGMRITNSYAMPNPEYGYEKPPHTRRIALFGDSVSIGPYGHDYVALLENRLNSCCLTSDIHRYEILNFAVYGYSVLQMMDVAYEKAPRFHPDAYLVTLTDLEAVARAGWRTHVARLILDRIDLKYDFVRQAATQAGVQVTDSRAAIVKKLEPSFLPLIHAALERIRDHAASGGASTMIALIPAPLTPDIAAADLDVIMPATRGLNVPVVDIEDTFDGVALDSVLVSLEDYHPNVRGHQLIFEHLFSALKAQPDAWQALTGQKP